MSVKQTIPSLLLFFALILAGCNDTSGNSAQSPFAGHWVKSQGSFVDDEDYHHIGLQVSEEGELAEISSDDSKHGIARGKVSQDGKIAIDPQLLREMTEFNPKLEITSFGMRMEKIDENRIFVRVTSIVGFYDGQPLEGVTAGEADIYERITAESVESVRGERLALIQNSAELIQSLAGTRWELVQKYSKRQDLTGKNPDSNYEYTIESEYIDEKHEYDSFTSYNFKKIRFVSPSELDINDGMFVSEFEYHPLKGLRAQDTSGLADYLKSDFGVISVNGDELVMSLDKVSSYSREVDGAQIEVRDQVIEIRTYKRVD